VLCNLPYDFGKKMGEKIPMGGVGSGNWYRFDKKTTAGETHSGLSSIKRYARMVPFIVN
jgi:hypothetical protein